jgi:phosphomannomutase
MSEELSARARAWVAQDPSAADRAQVQAWLDVGDEAELEASFGSQLSFGTAGLRGPLRPGPAGMNLHQVARVTAAVAAHLDAENVEGPVVIGFDGRRGSRAFALEAARVLTAMGRRVLRFDHVVPTPLVAWTVRQEQAAAGLVVTASHNPPDDNGYKVFWSDGAQIIPPHDGLIAKALAAVRELPEGGTDGEVLPASTVRRYLDDVLALRVRPGAAPITVVYTPLHGVGAPFVKQVLADAGYDRVHVVAAQEEPDGSFPTVAFPNPEEEGALDLAMALAEEVGADLVVANDPDADRLALAVPVVGGWRRLTGNEIGNLLAEELLTQGRFPEPRGVANTIVSSTRLARIAAHHGVRYRSTLTGFKWLARVSMALHDEGGTLVLGYEEALGYSVGGLVRDKDGVSAALIAVDMAAAAKAEGRTLVDLLDEQDHRYGALAGRQCSLVRQGPEGLQAIRAAMQGLRDAPPASLGGAVVTARTDLSVGERVVGGAVEPVDLPRSDVLAYELEGGHRALVRPSGTEPKLKVYVEATAASTGDLVADRSAARVQAEAIEADLLARVG